MVGIIAVNGALYVAGPSLLIPAFVAGAGAVVAAADQRPLYDHDISFAKNVLGHIDYSRTRLTNLLGPTNRAFVCLLPGGTLLLNIELAFDTPTTDTSKGRLGTENTRAPGKLFIHELTNAWQFWNGQIPAFVFYGAAVTAIGGDRSDYNYGPAGPAWSSFSTEAQASIVAGWFAGNTPRERRTTRREPRHLPADG